MPHAIHPGYGFLIRKLQIFPEFCAEAPIYKFIGGLAGRSYRQRWEIRATAKETEKARCNLCAGF